MAAMPAKIVRRRDRNTSDPDRLMIAFVEGKERLVEQNEDDVAGRKQCVYEEVTDARCSYPLGRYSSPAVRHRTPVGGVDVTSQHNHQRKVAIEVVGGMARWILLASRGVCVAGLRVRIHASLLADQPTCIHGLSLRIQPTCCVGGERGVVYCTAMIPAGPQHFTWLWRSRHVHPHRLAPSPLRQARLEERRGVSGDPQICRRRGCNTNPKIAPDTMTGRPTGVAVRRVRRAPPLGEYFLQPSLAVEARSPNVRGLRLVRACSPAPRMQRMRVRRRWTSSSLSGQSY